jgi:lipopolysaccharide export system permease protein
MDTDTSIQPEQTPDLLDPGTQYEAGKQSRVRAVLRGCMKFLNMHVLNWYLFKMVLVTFLMALLIVTFLMLMGSLVQIVELIFKKFSVIVILHFLAVSIPSVICYALPFSMAGASLLVYSRLSADGEITAMKANGVSIYRIAAPPIVLSIIIAVIAVFAYNNILPWAATNQKAIIAGYNIEDPSALIETGSWITMGRYRLFIENREGKILRNIQLVQDVEDGKTRRIDARSGTVRYIPLENKIHFEMTDVVSEERSPEHTNSFLRMAAGRVDMYVDMSKQTKRTRDSIMVRRTISEYTTKELEQRIIDHNNQLVRKACRRLPEFLALDQSNRQVYVDGLNLERRKELVKEMFGQLDEAHRKWKELQQQASWRQLLKEKKKKSRDAWIDIVNNKFKQYEQDLAAIDGKDGETTKLFREWHVLWPQGFHNALDERSRCMTTINYRLSYALASIAFVIIGIPLGIRAHRSEKTIGFLICLMLIAIHYALVIIVTQFKEYYSLQPHLLVWIPDLIFIATGTFLMWRNHHYS